MYLEVCPVRMREMDYLKAGCSQIAQRPSITLLSSPNCWKENRATVEILEKLNKRNPNEYSVGFRLVGQSGCAENCPFVPLSPLGGQGSSKNIATPGKPTKTY